jgi:short subunit dehydrogenase-like uncharacterized protein
MTAAHDVIVYGASGYTGKLIAERLAARNIAFTAAGRSRGHLEEAMAALPATAQFAIAAAPHTAGELHRLFENAKVVINVVGPFGPLGRPVVEAALAAGCHYLDTTGEQDWVALLRRDFGPRFAARGLLLCPACAWMWTGGLLAAELCLETHGIDSLDILYAPNGAATIASTLSFMRMVNLAQYRLVDRKLEPWPPATRVAVCAPHTHDILVGLPWGGGCEPIWYADDGRVRNCRVLVAFPDNPGIQWLLQCMHEYQEAARTRTAEELEELTLRWGMSIAKTPPREVPEVNRCIVECKARGTLHGRNLTLYATSPYLQTASLLATAVQFMLASSSRATGFCSPARAFGARDLIAALAADGLHCQVC